MYTILLCIASIQTVDVINDHLLNKNHIQYKKNEYITKRRQI